MDKLDVRELLLHQSDTRNQLFHVTELDLITRRIISKREGSNVPFEVLKEYCNPDSPKYEEMIDEIKNQLHFTTLRYHRLDDMLDSIGIDKECLCTYCWNGEE